MLICLNMQNVQKNYCGGDQLKLSHTIFIKNDVRLALINYKKSHRKSIKTELMM